MNFKLLNIPVYINPTFWLFLVFFTDLLFHPSIEGLIVGSVLFVSLMVHEFGHAITALFFGAKPVVTLEAFGGNARYESYGITPWQQFLITLNGPLFESVLIGLSYYFLQTGLFENFPYVQYFLHVTMHLNILWCLLNLIPIAPLDGGHMMRYLLQRKWGDKGIRVSILIGIACTLIAVPYLFLMRFYFFGILLLIFGWRNYQELTKIKSLNESPYSAYLSAIDKVKNGDLNGSKFLLENLITSNDAMIRNASLDALAKIYYENKQYRKAYKLLLKSDHKALKEGKCILCKLAFDWKNYELIGKHSTEIYALEPTFEIALLNSKAFAQLNQPFPSGGWFETASLFGQEYFQALHEALQQPIYDPVRENSVFKKFIKLFD